MQAVWTHLRRLVTSVMLVAVTSFVLHGAAVTGSHAHGLGPVQGASTSHAHHGHGTAHHHPDGTSHIHGAGQDGAGAGHDHHAGGGEAPCCGSICTMALAPFGPDAASAPIALAAALKPVSQEGSGIDPNGLKRPPRTPCIA